MNGTRGLVIATAAAFIIGCSAGLMGGIALMRLAGPSIFAFGRHGAPFFTRHVPGPGETGRMLPKLESALNLSPEQRERIVAHLDRARREQAVVRESLQTWIERELKPDQRVRWKQLQDQFERSRRERWGRDTIPPGRP